MEWLVSLLALASVIMLTPLMIWLLQLLSGTMPKRGGVAGAFMEGFGAAFEPQQERVQDAKRETNKAGRDTGEPPNERR